MIRFMRRVALLLSTLAILLVGLLVNRLAHSYFTTDELATAQGQLSLYRSTVIAELERHSHLTHILARDTFVTTAVEGAGTGPLNDRLEDFSDKSGLDAIYLMANSGVTIAASNHALPSSFVGQNYAFRPYFKNALQGTQGRFYAIGTTTGLPGYFIADAVRDRAGQIRGVIAIKKSFSELEDSWSKAGEQVILSDQNGVVLLASHPNWRYRTLHLLDDARKKEIAITRQFPGQSLEPLDWHDGPDNHATIAGDERLHLVANDLPNGWQLHYFANDDRAVARTWLATALIVVLAATLLIAFQIQRARRISRALQRAKQEEAQLRQTNAVLAVEIADRKQAQDQLHHAQKELEQASRLAALGELSASVTHELGQPIAAMRNHLAAAELNPSNAGNLSTNIADLVTRMEGITRQLKFFASSGEDPFEDFDLGEALAASLKLMAPNIEHTHTQISQELPAAPVLFRGNRLRIEQVMTNLLRNAVDAAENHERPQLTLRLGGNDHACWFEVQDNGHGLGAATLADLQEPFVTTRESGRGMGLGLAISAKIIKDHGGTMSARNTETGGAVFRVDLPKTPSSQDQEQ